MTAAATIVACADNDVLNGIDTSETPITFSKVYIENGTKAIAKGAYDQTNFETVGNSFGVFGYKTTPTQSDYLSFDDVRVEYQEGLTVSTNGYESTTDWAYSPLVYWDKNATAYNFYAYAPHENDLPTGTSVTLSANRANALSISGFKQATTSNADMYDLMTDTTTHKTFSGTIGTNDVAFSFSHILSNITVRMAVGDALKDDYANNPVTVVSVSIGAVKMDGSYAYDTPNWAYKWTLASTPTTATFSGTQTSGNVFGSNVLTKKGNDGSGFQNVPGLENLLFIPQSVDAGYKITVQYKIGDETFDTEVLLSAFKDSSNNTLPTWVPGYKYTYDLIIGPTPILFDIDNTNGVNGWSDGGHFEYTIE